MSKETPIISAIPNFQRLSGESDQAFRDRLDGRVAYVAGKAKLQADFYDTEKGFYPLLIRWDNWVKPFESKLQGTFYLDADTKTIQSLCQSGAEHTVVVYLGFDNGNIQIKFTKTHLLHSSEEASEIKENFPIKNKGVCFVKISLKVGDVEHAVCHHDNEQLWRKLKGIINADKTAEAKESCAEYLSSPTVQHHREEVIKRLMTIRQEETLERLKNRFFLLFLIIIASTAGLLSSVFVFLGMWGTALFFQEQHPWTLLYFPPIIIGFIVGMDIVFYKFAGKPFIYNFVKRYIIKKIFK